MISHLNKIIEQLIELNKNLKELNLTKNNQQNKNFYYHWQNALDEIDRLEKENKLLKEDK